MKWRRRILLSPLRVRVRVRARVRARVPAITAVPSYRKLTVFSPQELRPLFSLSGAIIIRVSRSPHLKILGGSPTSCSVAFACLSAIHPSGWRKATAPPT